MVEGGSLLEVPTVRLWLGKFWCFGLAVAYGRWSHLEVWMYSFCKTLYSLSEPINLNQFWDWKIFLLLTVTNSKQLSWIIKSLNAMEHWVCTWYQRSLTQKLSHFTSTLRSEQRCIKPKKKPPVRYTIHKNLNIHTRINSVCKVSY